MRETESGPLTLKKLQVSWGKRWAGPERDTLWTSGCGPERRATDAQRWENKCGLQRSGASSGRRRDGSRALARCRIGGGAGQLCQMGQGLHGDVLTFSPSCSSSSWSRSMIVWINFSKKEQSGCLHSNAQKSSSVVCLHFLRPRWLPG